MVKVMNNYAYIGNELVNKVHQLTKELIKTQELIKILEKDNQNMKDYLESIKQEPDSQLLL